MDSLKVDVRKLHLFNGLAKEGAETVADNLQQMSGLETAASVSKLNFLDFDDVGTHLRTETESDSHVGIYTELEDAPHGYLLFLVSRAEAKRLANAMLGQGAEAEADGSGFTDMQKSAIQEVGNIMTSAFIDGWANVLGTTIAHSPPHFAYGDSETMLSEIGGWPDTDIVFVVDSQITAADVDFSLTCYTFPELEPLVDLIHDIDVDSIADAETAPTDFSELV
ncbi:chemotaxis protein [Halorientalis sp. IM1011]|uniref:chemotaxis protein CheC n=1 Tax=Halorientalis sp. IM1011 TaxID=1932360 RepID=UPI00097CC272|nr:chemotaxis protein CheC [Halorientalis sp. IM1011]AQL42703.1 chemotaxis protein [Halorientalis sp. IM1011]